jgi:tRNA-Thr(GGU) m(6)t(6)A37 methyltransferase TsaA
MVFYGTIPSEDHRGGRDMVEMEPIGTVHTPYTASEEIPLCASERLEEVAVVEVFHDYAEGLADVDGFSHLMLLVHLHLTDVTKLLVHPPIDDSGQARGVFATRSPVRPNHIGVSIVELVKVEGRNLIVKGIDLLDGTPLLDIKPYIPYDQRTPCRIGWLEGKAVGQGGRPVTAPDVSRHPKDDDQ